MAIPLCTSGRKKRLDRTNQSKFSLYFRLDCGSFYVQGKEYASSVALKTVGFIETYNIVLFCEDQINLKGCSP